MMKSPSGLFSERLILSLYSKPRVALMRYLDRAGHQIIRDVLDVLAAGFGRFFAGERGANGVLR